MTQGFYAGFGTTQPSFVGYIQDGKIYCSELQGQQLVGVTSKIYDELKSDYDSIYARCQQYYDRLVDLGEIKPALTGEELIKAQADELARTKDLLNQMQANQDKMQANQERLMAFIQHMQGQIAKEESNECFADDTETHTGHLPSVAGTDNGVQQGSQPVSKHKARPAKGNSRKATQA